MTSNFLHKIKLQYLFLVLILSAAASLFAQQIPKNNFTEAEVESFVIEIFQHKNARLILNTKTKRMQLITRFLDKQYSVSYSPEYKGKNYKTLSSLKLNNKHNKHLSIDKVYNPKTFNPLKYKFPLHSHSDEMYRVGNTDYIITIHSLN